MEVMRILLVDDHHLFREGMASLISSRPDLEIVGQARDGIEALKIARETRPDVVLMDIGLPGMSGIEGTRRLKERFPEMVLLVHSVYDDDERIFDALCAGASGYLLKKTPPARLLESLQEAAKGGAPMTPEVASRVVKLFREHRPPDRSYELTPHELRLLKLLMEGHNYKTAAVELGVTTHTVSFHLQKIYEKLHVHSKTEAVAKALQDRLLK